MSTKDASSRPDLMGEVKFKIPLPIVIPLGALAAIGALAFGFSRVLLSLPKEGATIVATATAANVVGACAFVALRPRMSQTTWIELAAVVVYPVVIGVAIAQIGFGETTVHEGGPPVPVGDLTTEVVAEGVAFTTATVTFAAGKEVSLTFDNKDAGTPHNFAIYESEADGGSAPKNPIFDGLDLTGPGKTIYGFTAPAPGEYYFQCDIHPDMNGTVVTE